MTLPFTALIPISRPQSKPMSKQSRSSRPSSPFVGVNQPQEMSAAQALQLASEHLSAGRLQQAETLIRQVLRHHPQHAPALYLMGLVAHYAGRAELALDFIGKAIANNNDVAQYHLSRGEMCRILGRVDEAIQHGERATTLDPAQAAAHSNLGIAYYDTGEYDKAEACQLKALAIDPNLSVVLNNLGSITQQRQQFDEATVYYQKAIKADPKNIEPMNNLGSVYLKLGRHQEALESLNMALALRPEYSDALCNRGHAYLGLENTPAAQENFHHSLQLRADSPAALLGMARIHQEGDRFSEAERFALRAAELSPDNPEAAVTLGVIYVHTGEADKAYDCFDRVLKQEPDSTTALHGMAQLYQETGQFERAEELLNKALTHANDKTRIRYHLALARKTTDNDENMAALLAESKQPQTAGSRNSLLLNMGLGKCYEDLADYETAFPYFMEGCRIKRSQFEYTTTMNNGRFDKIKSALNQVTIERLKGAANNSSRPVFIVGMPRSGTTLTEQIIASHPDVYGAGELYDLQKIIDSSDDQHLFPDNLATLSNNQLTSWGKQYISALHERNSLASRVTDKMPSNFLLLGLIHAMLPNAKVIHVLRHPLDTCVSCFTKLFHRGQKFTYDLEELGQYYVQYQLLMEHWKQVLPANSFLEVQYEELVLDNEAQTRRLIDYCDLEWNKACLEFHKTDRPIRTASINQVRQPIYTSAINKWQRYEKFLGPLIDALGDRAQTNH